MENTNRIEIAEKMCELINDNISNVFGEARVWAKGDHVRVYAGKGYVTIDKNGIPVTENLNRNQRPDVQDMFKENGISFKKY